MRRVLDMHRMVKLVERVADELDTNYPSPVANTLIGYAFVEPFVADIKTRYSTDYGCGLRKAQNVLNDCYKNKYLLPSTRDINNQKVEILSVTPDGRWLTDGWKYLPWGLWRKWAKDELFFRWGTMLILGVIAYFSMDLVITLIKFIFGG